MQPCSGCYSSSENHYLFVVFERSGDSPWQLMALPQAERSRISFLSILWRFSKLFGLRFQRPNSRSWTIFTARKLDTLGLYFSMDLRHSRTVAENAICSYFEASKTPFNGLGAVPKLLFLCMKPQLVTTSWSSTPSILAVPMVPLHADCIPQVYLGSYSFLLLFSLFTWVGSVHEYRYELALPADRPKGKKIPTISCMKGRHIL